MSGLFFPFSVGVTLLLSGILLAPYPSVAADKAPWTETIASFQELMKKGDYAAAKQAAKTALETAKRIFGPKSAETGRSLHALARATLETGPATEAESLCRKALTTQEKTIGKNHPEYADTLTTLATVLQARDKFKPAQETARQALATLDTSPPSNEAYLFRCLKVMGHISFQLNEVEQARLFLERARALRKDCAGQPDAECESVLHNLGATYLALRRFPEADELLLRVANGPEHVPNSESIAPRLLFHLALSNGLQNRKEEAGRYYRKAIPVIRKVLGNYHPLLADALVNLAILYHDEGEADEAVQCLEEAATIRQRVFGAGHPLAADATMFCGMAYYALGDRKRTSQLWDATLKICETRAGTAPLELAHARVRLGIICGVQKDFGKSEKLLLKAMPELEKHPETELPCFRVVLNLLSECCDVTGRPEKARTYRERLRALPAVTATAQECRRVLRRFAINRSELESRQYLLSK